MPITGRVPERFEIIRTLGAGGMGVVHEALDRVRSEHVALKTMIHADADAVYRLKREFRALADLEHPNLARLYDLFVDEGGTFLTMELVRGVDPGVYVRTVSPVDPTSETVRSGSARLYDESAVRHVLAGLLRGLGALHEAGLLHRDLKPSNVLVTPDGRVVLLDFGLVADAHAAVQQTVEGAVAGTVAYMAPEQARGERELTTACDIYAVGVMLFEFLTGRLPFLGAPMVVMLAKQREDAPRPSSLTEGIPEDLEGLVLRMLARDPSERPRAGEVLAMLGSSTSARPHTSRSDARVASRLDGREPELAALHEALRETADGSPVVALVRGASGIGKSALIGTFAKAVESEGACVLAGRCYEFESVPFKGLDGVVDALSHYLARSTPEQLGLLLPPNLHDLATLFPVLRRIAPIAAAHARRARTLHDQSAVRARAQGFECLRELLRRIGELTALVIVVDDVHWADEDSAKGLAELLRGDHPPMMLLVLGTRPSETAPVLRDVLGGSHGNPLSAARRTIVDVGPLGTEAVRAFVERELGTASGHVELVVRESNGNPFAAGQFVRFLRDGDFVPAHAGGDAPIDALVQRRAALLDQAPRAVLELLAVCGEPIGPAVLLAAAGLPADDRAPLDALRSKAFVRSHRSDGKSLVDTAHDRVRESIVEQLPADRRRTLHRRLARALETEAAPSHDQIARHFHAAGDLEAAFVHALDAANDAKHGLAFLRAAEFYAIALDGCPANEKRQVRVQYAEALGAAGRYVDAAAAWLGAAAGEPGSGARNFRIRAAESLLYAGRIDEGLAQFDALAGDIGVRIPQRRWAVYWELLKGHLWLAWLGRRLRVRARSEIPSEEIDELRVIQAIAVQYGPLDPFRGAVPAIRFLMAALRVGEGESLAVALCMHVMVLCSMDRLGSAATWTARLASVARSVAPPLAGVCLAASEAAIALVQGHANVAFERTDRAIELLEASPAIPQWMHSIVYFLYGIGTSMTVEVKRTKTLQRFVDAREAQAGPCAELRLGFAVLHHERLCGGSPLDPWTRRESLWTRATSREVVFKTTEECYSIPSLMACGDFAEARKRGERVREAYVRQGIFRHSAMVRCGCLAFLSAAALATRDPKLIRRCLAEVGTNRTPIVTATRHLIQAHLYCCAERSDEAIRELVHMRAVANAASMLIFELSACWALGFLDGGAVGAESRERFAAIVAATGIVDAELQCWAGMPLGPRPPRSAPGARSPSPG